VSFSCGIVGLPNVGKSSLFNLLTGSSIASSNYPFTTIDPNVGVVPVPDERLAVLEKISKSAKVIPAAIHITDIAGLVKGASQGEGLGNQFLSHIREVDVIIHVLRFFEEKDVVHIGEVDPVRDIEIIETELLLKDLESLENRKSKTQKKAKSGEKIEDEMKLIDILMEHLNRGNSARTFDFAPFGDGGERLRREFFLLTDKKIILLANVGENQINKVKDQPDFVALGKKFPGVPFISLSVKVEGEIMSLSEEERGEFLKELGIEESGIDRLVRAGYEALGLISYFTSGEKETRAWSVTRGTLAPRAAGKIHTDFEKGFIRAEVVSYDKFVGADGYIGAREKGFHRLEGKEYAVQDGDVIIFRFNK